MAFKNQAVLRNCWNDKTAGAVPEYRPTRHGRKNQETRIAPAGFRLGPGVFPGQLIRDSLWSGLIIQKKAIGCQGNLGLAPLRFYSLFFYGKPSLWPGSKAVMRKKHRREKNSSRRSNRFSAERGGPIGRPDFGELPSGLSLRVEDSRAAGRPYNGITLFLRKERLARPVQEMIQALWFLRITALLPGRAMPEIQSILSLLGEK